MSCLKSKGCVDFIQSYFNIPDSTSLGIHKRNKKNKNKTQPATGPDSVVAGIVKEVREALMRFQKLWNFPNGVGAIDRKYITIQAPTNRGYHLNNNNGLFSIVPLATVEGSEEYGKSSDRG